MSPSDLEVLEVLYKIDRHVSKGQSVSLAVIDLFSRYSRATIDRKVRRLEALGYIDVERTPDVRGFLVRKFRINQAGYDVVEIPF